MAKKNQRNHAAECKTCGARNPITATLDIIAGHDRDYYAAEKAEDREGETIAFEAMEGAIFDLLARARPMSLDHLATFVALGRGFAAVGDLINKDGTLVHDSGFIYERLALLDRVLFNVVHGLCLNGAAVHDAVHQYATEDDLTAWKNAALLAR